MIYQIIFHFVVFIFAFFVTFYLPGSLVVSFFKVRSKLIGILLSFVFGIVMWGLQGYVFGYLNIRWLTYLYIGFSFLYSFIYRRNFLVKAYDIFPKIFFANKIPVIVITVGIIVQLLAVMGSGLNTGNGITFFGNNAFDGLTHLGFIQSLIDHFPPIEPGAYGFPLRNYHYLSDLVIGEFSRIWGIPISLLLFQFFPFLVSLFTGVAAYLAVRNFGGSKAMGNWMIFLIYFGGDGAYIFMLILHRTFGFYTPAIDNGAMQFLNMPNAMAKMIFITALIPLQYFISSSKKTWGIFSVLFLAPLIGFKIYFGIFSILGFLLLILNRLTLGFIRNLKANKAIRVENVFKNEFFSLFLLLLFAGIVFTIYLPANASSGGLFYAPLEWPKSFLGAESIDWKDWWFRMQVYEVHKNYRNIIILDTLAIIIALVSIHGTRLLGFFLSFKLLKFLGWDKTLFFIPGLFLFHFLGLYTLQSAGGLNVFNFFVVGAVVLSIFSAFILGKLSESKKILIKVLLIVFVVLTIPRVAHEAFYNIDNYGTHADSYTISNEELSALKYIDTNTPKDAIVQAHPNNEKDYKVGYLSTFSKRSTYLSGVVFLETRNQKIADKKQFIHMMFEANNIVDFVKLAKEKHIGYIYLQKVPLQSLKFSPENPLLRVIYENKFITILKVL